MRSKSLISIIRKYGISSKRLSPKSRIKYEDAIKAIKGYETSELKIEDVVDNFTNPQKSVSCHCQVPGCGHAIRYEYHLRNKVDNTLLVAGSTCVWPLLGLSEIERKNFNRYDDAIREFYALSIWKDDNKDVLSKLDILKHNKIYEYRPFWEELEYCRLTDEDTEYIRSLDVDKVLEKKKEKEYKKAQAISKTSLVNELDYRILLDKLNTLVDRYPNNSFYQSLKQKSSKYRLTDKQLDCIKKGVNKMWYEDIVKGKPFDCWDICDNVVYSAIRSFDSNSTITLSYIRDNIKSLCSYFSTLDKATKLAWSVFRVKNDIVS